MFCEECGTKNVNGSQFCENCGHKLQQPEKVVKEKKPRKKLGIKTYIIIGAIALIIVAYFVGSFLTSPKRIAETYFKAISNVDVDTVYGFLETGNSEFTTKEVFNKVIGDIDSKKMKIVNYTISDMKKETSGMTGTVTITYLIDGETESDTMEITFVKDKSKKYLIYDNWKIQIDGYKLVDDYTVQVMKGSIVEIEGIKLDSKYLNNDESTNAIDVYSMPSLFNTTYNIKVTLPIGITTEDTMNVYSGSKYTLDYISKSDISDETKTKITNKSKEVIQSIYTNALEGKSWDDIKSTYEITDVDISTVKTAYENLAASLLTASNKLTSIEYTSVEISSLTINNDNTLNLTLKGSYKYAIKYDYLGEEKTHEDTDYDYFYVTLGYLNGEFYVSDISSLETYFSRY